MNLSSPVSVRSFFRFVWSLSLVVAVADGVARLAGAEIANNWVGAIRCEIQVEAPGYFHQETQTWTLTGAAPTVQGAFVVFPATWTVSGQGWSDQTRNTNRRATQWNTDVPGKNSPVKAPVAFALNIGTGQLVVKSWHAQLRAPGYRGTDQYTNGGVAQTAGRMAQDVFEWQFPAIEADPASIELSGTTSNEVKATVGPMQPLDATVTITCTWELGQGTAKPLPPSTLKEPQLSPTASIAKRTTAPAKIATIPALTAKTGTPSSGTASTSTSTTTTPANGTSTASGTNPAGTTPNSTPPAGGGTTRPPEPQLLKIAPDSVSQGVTGMQIVLTGRATHWVTGTTAAYFGPGITVTSFTVVSDTTAVAAISVAPSAGIGSRPVIATTPTASGIPEEVGLPDTFKVTAGVSTQPATTTPASTTPATTTPATTTPATTTPATTQPATTTPASTTPAATTPVSTTPAATTPASATPDTTQPATTTPATTTPDASQPAGSTPAQLPGDTTGPVFPEGTQSALKKPISGQIASLIPSSINSVTPSGASVGAPAMSVALVGTSTHFVAGTSKADFGPGITVQSLTVNSPTAATAVVLLDGTAAAGPRTVLVTTGAEKAQKPNGFSVSFGPAPASTSSAGRTPTSTPAVVAAPASGYYIISINAVWCGRPTADDPLDFDGHGDEIYCAACVRRYDRKTSTIQHSSTVVSQVYGDSNKSTRVQAGTQTGMGGIAARDPIPFYATSDSSVKNLGGHPNLLPMPIWWGRLSDGGDVLAISPSVWESDGENSFYTQWANQQDSLKDQLFGNLHDQIDTKRFGPMVLGGVITLPNGATTALVNGANMVFGGLPVLQFFTRGHDRPIGLVANGATDNALPNTVVVLTREIIERALSATPLPTAPPDPGDPSPARYSLTTPFPVGPLIINTAKPGILLIAFQDQAPIPGNLGSGDGRASYVMALQVQRVSAASGSSSDDPTSDPSSFSDGTTSDPTSSTPATTGDGSSAAAGATPGDPSTAGGAIGDGSSATVNGPPTGTHATSTTTAAPVNPTAQAAPEGSGASGPVGVTPTKTSRTKTTIAAPQGSGSTATSPVGTVTSTIAPVLSGISPNSGPWVDSYHIALTGTRTHFVQGKTTVDFGPGFYIREVAVISPTSAVAVVDISFVRQSYIRTVTVTTGNEVVTRVGGFTVTDLTFTTISETPGKEITVTPNAATVGTTNLSIQLKGSDFLRPPHFVQGSTTADFGPGITLAVPLMVTAPDRATAVLNISRTATPGWRPVTLTTGSEVAIVANNAGLLLSLEPDQFGKSFATATSFTLGPGSSKTVHGALVNSDARDWFSLELPGAGSSPDATITLKDVQPGSDFDLEFYGLVNGVPTGIDGTVSSTSLRGSSPKSITLKPIDLQSGATKIYFCVQVHALDPASQTYTLLISRP